MILEQGLTADLWVSGLKSETIGTSDMRLGIQKWVSTEKGGFQMKGDAEDFHGSWLWQLLCKDYVSSA